MDAHALATLRPARGRERLRRRELVFKRLFVSDGPVDIAAVCGSGGHGDIKNFGDTLGVTLTVHCWASVNLWGLP